ncbi:MAG: zinc ribbon domain-containing protein [Candidatus Zixiibacteriota bacterium]|nr:MAG: zinc ribbon domain-containing protein [candidate division Zixibacteria bacterium]
MSKKLIIQNYRCPKCGGQEYIQKKVHMTGGFFSKIFDIQNRKFFASICKNDECGYTEFYARRSSLVGNALDFFTG